ncbi:DNA-3-methyladenine glycosylase I [Aquimarina sp. W85]|uniref:DNA-3-methyladenine glycosylase I n=1 Tax=Aquimarina rhodophyticola TaxID=3342246 RepID=UPI00366C3C8A
MDKQRCHWCSSDVEYQKYHDQEWGVPVHDDTVLFEFLLLESFQAGLSWLTILKKRENFRKAFDNFDYTRIAMYDQVKIEELLRNSGIIRNKLKINAAIMNAQNFMKVQQEFESFDNYIWSFVTYTPIKNHWKHFSECPATTPLSDKISKDLKDRGFKFVGSTIIYAYMQAIGMVDDHEINCFKY